MIDNDTVNTQSYVLDDSYIFFISIDSLSVLLEEKERENTTDYAQSNKIQPLESKTIKESNNTIHMIILRARMIEFV
jgi:hypothetical protein